MTALAARREESPVSRQRLEVADVFRAHLDRAHKLRPAQAQVVRNICACRTAQRGGHLLSCDFCEHQEHSYNSCCDRHCPKCQSLVKARWLEARKADLLPTQYFHVVFTIPHGLNSLVLRNKKKIYSVLFRAASETLHEVSRTRLGARIGFTAILHSWSQTVAFHPHLHCVVTGGGLSPERDRWIHCHEKFFLPVPVLSVVFRGKFLDYLERSYDNDELTFPGKIWHLADPERFKRLLITAARKQWNVYAKKPFSSPEDVLEYFSRYVHRVAISNHRLVSLENGKVTLKYRDYADHDKVKTMELDAGEFIDRFLLHVLPKGFMRIRHYGLLSNRNRNYLLPLCRMLLGEEQLQQQEAEDWQDLMFRLTGKDLRLCPKCRKGHLIRVSRILPQRIEVFARYRSYYSS